MLPRTAAYRSQSSKRLDTDQGAGYPLPVRRLDQGPARNDDPSASRGDVYDQGRTRRPCGRHRTALEVADRRGPHAVLAGDYGRPAGGLVRRIAGLWTLPAPSPPTAGQTEPPHGGNRPDSSQSRPHLYGGEGLPGTGATQRRGCGRGRVRSMHGVAGAHRQGAYTPAPRSRELEDIPGVRHRCPLRCLPRDQQPAVAPLAGYGDEETAVTRAQARRRCP